MSETLDDTQATVDSLFEEYHHGSINAFQLGQVDEIRMKEVAGLILDSPIAPTQLKELAEGAPEAVGWTIASLKRYAGRQ